MKTDDLIRALAADRSPAMAPGRALILMLPPAAIVSAIAFALTLGPRADIGVAIGDPRFLMKFVVVLLLAVTAAGAALRLVRPGASTRSALLLLAAAPAALALQIAVELVLVPRGMWSDKLTGSNALVCLTAVPLLALPPLAAILLALRRGAPTRPALAGAVAGLLAGSLGAFLYAMQCTDDSPLFVAVWYTLAIAIVTAVAAAAGRVLLRW